MSAAVLTYVDSHFMCVCVTVTEHSNQSCSALYIFPHFKKFGLFYSGNVLLFFLECLYRIYGIHKSKYEFSFHQLKHSCISVVSTYLYLTENPQV